MGLSILSLTLAVLAPQQTVTLNAPAQTLDHLIVKLSAACGERLAVSSALAKEVVTINVKDVDSGELLKFLAKVTGGVWVSSSDGQRLDKDTSLESIEKQQALAERTAFLKAEIAKQVAELNKMPVFDAAKIQEEMTANRGQGQQGRGQGRQMVMMPGNRAIVQTLSSMRPDDLARIAVGQRVVYTTSPTPMQKALPGNSINVMRTFAADQQKVVALFGNRGANGPGRNGQNPQNQQQQQNPVVPAKAFLIVTRLGFGDSLNLSYIVADANGRTLGNAGLTLGQDIVRNDLAAEAAKDTTDPVVTLSDLGKAAVQAFGRGGGRMGDMIMVRGAALGTFTTSASGTVDASPGLPQANSPELTNLLRDPVTNEPLSYHVTEAVNAAANGKNLVALLPDSLGSSMAQFLNGKRTSPQTLNALKDTWKMEVEESDGWLTIAPKRRIDARLERVDRAALKTLLDATLKKGSARLDDVAIYATKAPMAGFGGVDSVVMRLVDPASSPALNAVYGNNRDMLVMYASMGQATRMGLARGQKMLVPSVSTNSLLLTGDMVYNSPDGPSVTKLDAGSQGPRSGGGGNSRVSPVQAAPAFSVTLALAAPDPVQQWRGPGGPGGGQGMTMSFGTGGDMTTERTEVLPRGVPGGTVLSMNTNTEVVAKAVRKDAGLARTYSSQSLGVEKAMSEVSDPNGRRVQPPTIAWDGYVPGTKSTYTFLFELAPGITLRRTLEDNGFDPTAKVASYDQLPAGFRNGVTQQYQQMKDNMTQRLNRAGQEQRAAEGRRGGRKPPGP